MNSAIYVDFDNIRGGLDNLFGNSCAEAFARQATKWLPWLRTRLTKTEGTTTGRVLSLKCYLNPVEFGMARPSFVEAGFQVFDCPPLTRLGKTGTDIRMLVDILEDMHARIHIEEFVILTVS